MERGEPAGQLAKGASLGRYVVLGLVGRGGMGEVYAAYDPELDRKIAIKLLKTAGAIPDGASQGRQRLLREAQAIARLSHPNVVVVHDEGEPAQDRRDRRLARGARLIAVTGSRGSGRSPPRAVARPPRAP